MRRLGLRPKYCWQIDSTAKFTLTSFKGLKFCTFQRSNLLSLFSLQAHVYHTYTYVTEWMWNDSTEVRVNFRTAQILSAWFVDWNLHCDILPRTLLQSKGAVAVRLQTARQFASCISLPGKCRSTLYQNQCDACGSRLLSGMAPGRLRQLGWSRRVTWVLITHKALTMFTQTDSSVRHVAVGSSQYQSSSMSCYPPSGCQNSISTCG